MDSNRRTWVHRAGSFALFAVGTAAVLAILLWLESVKAWWSAAVSSYVMGLLLVGGGVGAYAGWAFDEVDDPREERRLGVIVFLLWVLLPLVFILGRQALLVRFDLAPGSWPAPADTLARVLVSISGVGMTVCLLALLVRRATRGPASIALWSAGAMFVLALVAVATWPWIGATLPIPWRGVLLLVALVAATACSKRIDRKA